MSLVRKSLAFSALDSYLGLLLSIVSTVIIARILTPEQTGIFAVAAVFASLASSFRDFGVAEYLIQEEELNDDAIRAAMTVNIATSWLMAGLMYASAPAVGEFYHSNGVAEVMRVQACNFLLIPFGAVTMAWFRREMNMQPIFIASLLANIGSFAVSVVLALAGFGYMSLAWSSLAGVVVTVAVSVWQRPPDFPRWPGTRGIAKVLHFGKFASGIYIFGQLGKGAPEIIIGRAQDLAAVGLFSRAYGLVEIFNRLVLRAVLPVCLPYFARSVRETGTPMRGFLLTVQYLTAIGWSFLLFMALGAYAVIRLMYGPQWVDAVSLSKILCAAAAIELIYYPAKEALLSMGKARESNLLQLVIQGLRVLGLAAAVPFGLPGACWGLLASSVLGAVASHLFLRKHMGLHLSVIGHALWSSAQLTALALAPFGVLVGFTPVNEGNYVAMGIGGFILCAACWLASLKLTRHPLWQELSGALAALRRWRKA